MRDSLELPLVTQQRSVSSFMADEWFTPLQSHQRPLDLEVIQTVENLEPMAIHMSGSLIYEPQAPMHSPLKVQTKPFEFELQLLERASQSTQECSPGLRMSPSSFIKETEHFQVEFEDSAFIQRSSQRVTENYQELPIE